MSETLRPQPSGRLLDREAMAWLGLAAVAALARLWRLGERVMSHDESLHAYYSWVLATTGGYEHDPALHGPLLYHVDALVFLLFGATDTTARLLAAFAGVAAVAMLRAFRPWLGRGGALAAAAIIAIDPTHLFYSRYIRNDALIVLFSLLWVLAMLRYMERRQRRWLALLTVAMALSFACKEVAFIQGWIFGLFALALAMRRSLPPPIRAAAGDLAVLMATLVLPFAAGAWHVFAGWPVPDDGSALALRRGLLTAAALALASLLLAVAWFSRRAAPHGGAPGLRAWAACMLGFWGFALLLFTGLGTRPRGGFLSGVVGSLGYWLGQHEVNRGSQPWFYYLLLAALYELVPVALALAGAIWLWRRRREPAVADWPLLGGRAAEVAPALGRGLFLELCLWWGISAWTAYSLAGERMPWLLIHPMLPLYLLAGWFLALLVSGIPRRLREEPRARSLVVAGALLPVALIGVTALPAPTDAAALLRWTMRAGVAIGLGAFAIRRARPGGARLLLVGAALTGLVWTARVATQAAFVRHDQATEPLVYAHGAPDVKAVMRELEMISLRTVGERQLPVAFHADASWPFVWYLRDFPNARVFTKPEELAGSGAAVVLATIPAPEWLWSHVARDFVPRNYRMVWWPLQEYAGRGPRELARWLIEPDRRERLRQLFLFRRYPGHTLAAWPLRKEIRMYVRRDLDPLGAQLPFALAGVPPRPFRTGGVDELEWVPIEVLAAAGNAGALSRPTAVAAMPEGGWAIADSGNARVVLLDAAGSLRAALSNRPDRAAPTQGEIWGVAAGPGGTLALADTWGGRIRLFGANGRPMATWGRFGTAAVDRPADPALYGPRGIVFSPGGEILVADTGNRRLLRYSPEGRPLGEVGMGAGSTRFDEPVGLAYAADGSLLVADTWNRRIVRLGDRLQPLDHWPVPGWESRDARDKPYLAVDAAGRVYATDPAAGRVLVFSPSGELLVGLRPPASLGTARPLGIAYQPEEDRLAVADWEGGRVLLFRPHGGV